jgi:hypothetical protein
VGHREASVGHREASAGHPGRAQGAAWREDRRFLLLAYYHRLLLAYALLYLVSIVHIVRP